MIKKLTTKEGKMKGGFITLTATLIIMAVMLLVVRGISLQAIDDAQVSSAVEQYTKARYLAEACAEYALMELSNDSGFSDSGEQSAGLGDDSCEVIDIDLDAPTTTLQVQGIVGDNTYQYRAEIVMSTTTATTTPSVVIYSWEEVDSF